MRCRVVALSLQNPFNNFSIPIQNGPGKVEIYQENEHFVSLKRQEKGFREKLYFPEQHHRVVPVDEPVAVEIKGTDRFILLDPVGVPEEDNGVIPVGEAVGVEVLVETVIVGIGWGIGEAGECDRNCGYKFIDIWITRGVLDNYFICE
jgi:hypothetical protein